MKDKAFVDTNVFIYLYSNDELEKSKKCQRIFENYYCVTSIQVLNEISNVMLKKFKIDPEQVMLVLQEIENNCLVNLINMATVQKALQIHKTYGYSYYDSLIVSSALENECMVLLTEDMQNGQKIEGTLTLKNIFDF
jgi:predicted nucleic acid-binding protein